MSFATDTFGSMRIPDQAISGRAQRQLGYSNQETRLGGRASRKRRAMQQRQGFLQTILSSGQLFAPGGQGNPIPGILS